MRNAKVMRMLGSWWLLTVLCLSLGAAYLFFTFGETPYARWTGFVFQHPLGMTLYIGAVICLVTATLRIILTSLTPIPASPEEIKAMDAWDTITGDGPDALAKVAVWMSSMGFPGTRRQNTVSSVQGRLSFLPGTVLRIGLIILLTALFCSALLRTTTTVVLHEGEEKVIGGSLLKLSALKAHLPVDFLQVGEESAFTLDGVSAVVSSSGTSNTISPGYPTPLAGQYARIIHLGYSQPVRITTARSTSEKIVDFDILPPGKTQIVTSASGDPVFFTFSLEPDRTINKGLLKGRQFNLAKPYYRVLIQDGAAAGKPVLAMARPGERASHGPVSLSFGQHSLYISLQSVQDPALPFIYTGVIVSLLGILLMLSRFFWYRKVIIALQDGTVVYIGYQEEFFKKWGILRFTNSVNIFSRTDAAS